MPRARGRPRLAIQQLLGKPVERIWGRTDIPDGFIADSVSHAPIGEIWFESEDPQQDALLVKYLFTAERLSVQVHPNDEQARARGHRSGKEEAWVILDAEPDAVIGLGLSRKVSAAELRDAALDGSIDKLLDWRPVRGGDVYYSPAGTVHAIGAGISLIEVQQNSDVTYRLYDYGRGRELHLEDALAVARRGPWSPPFEPVAHSEGRRILAAGRRFVLERWTMTDDVAIDAGRGELLLIPLAAGGTLDGEPLNAGTVWSVDGSAVLDGRDGVDLLATYAGSDVRDEICVRRRR